MNRVLFSSQHDNWKTPEALYVSLNDEFKFNFDPCPLAEHVLVDGLSVAWGSSTFCNPPYSQIALWIKKGFDEAALGKNVVFLIPSRTDTKCRKGGLNEHSNTHWMYIHSSRC